MKGPSNKSAILLRGDLALSPNANTTWMSDDLADHVFGRVTRRRLQILHVRLAPTDGPLGDVVGPDVGGHAFGRFAITEREYQRVDRKYLCQFIVRKIRYVLQSVQW